MSLYIQTEKNPKELPKDFELRCWRDRIHRNKEGWVIIPPMMIVKSIQSAASYLGMKIPGKRNATYTKHFLAGIRCNETMVLPIKYDEVPGEWFLVPSDGKSGGGSRVEKCFPVIDEWEGALTMYITDDLITRDVFEYHVKTAGQLIGIGRFRPARGGYYGCFKAEVKEWKDI
jgi:hypothetical protein